MTDDSLPQKSLGRAKSPPVCKRCGAECFVRVRVCVACAKAKRSAYLKNYLVAYREEHAPEISEQRREYRARNVGRFDEADSARARAWYAENRERARERMAAGYAADPSVQIVRSAESRRKRREADLRGYRLKEAEYRRRRRESLKQRVSDRMSNRLWYALRAKGGAKKGKWLSYVDYTVEQLIERLNATMPIGSSWADFFSGALHIDHILPIASFSYTSPEDDEFKRCWALSNLQLLPALDNIKKNSRLDWSPPPFSRGAAV